jgi:hypothetical protein
MTSNFHKYFDCVVFFFDVDDKFSKYEENISTTYLLLNKVLFVSTTEQNIQKSQVMMPPIVGNNLSMWFLRSQSGFTGCRQIQIHYNEL